MNTVVVVFLALRSGPGKKNHRYRHAARATFLDPHQAELPLAPGGASAFGYRFFVDGPCCEGEDDVVARTRTENDVMRGLVDDQFNALYSDASINYKTQWGQLATHNYGRDWDISIVTWAVRHYTFQFILSTDDDALLCTQNLVYQLLQPPFQHAKPFVLGFPRWDQFDNCFILLSSSVASFLGSGDNYRTLLRPGHANNSHGATFGAA